MLEKLLVLVLALYGLCMVAHPGGHGEAAVQPSGSVISPYAGNYEIPPGEYAKITRQGGHHYLDLSDGEVRELIPTAEHTFQFGSGNNNSLRFLVDDDGRALGFILSPDEGSQVVAERAEVTD